MLTPKEVEERRFPLVRMRQGYEIGSVDSFLDELTADYTALYEENAALKAKMKVLIQHITDQSQRIRNLEAAAEETAEEITEPVVLTVLPAAETEEPVEMAEDAVSEEAEEQKEPVEV